MKKIYFLLLILPVIFFTSCEKKGYVDIQYFNFYVKNCTTPFEVQFYLDVRYQPKEVSITWDFGDGTTSSEHEPVHVYQNTGKYTVKVKIVNYKTTIEKSIVVDVSQSPMTPVLDFNVKSNYGKYYAPCEIQFLNNSQYSSNFYWNFGDGFGSNEDSPTHIYDSAGVYYVYLNSYCNNDTAASVYELTILPPPTQISIDVVEIWLPEMYLNHVFELEYFIDNYYETPPLQSVRAVDFPFGWVIGNTLDEFYGDYNAEDLYFQIWDVGNNQSPVYSFGIEFKDIKNNFYPDTLKFSSSDGFGANVMVSYESK